MDQIVVVYLAYLWVGLLHSCFAGITLYSIWGRKISNLPKLVPMIILFVFLGLLEVYWIPVFSVLDLGIFTESSALHEHFNINGETNIVQALRPNWLMVSMWMFQTFLAYRIGNYIFKKNTIDRHLPEI